MVKKVPCAKRRATWPHGGSKTLFLLQRERKAVKHTHGGWWVWSRGSEAAPRMHVSIFPAKNKSSSPPKWWRLGGDGATVTSQPTRRRGNPQGSTEGASGSAPVCWPQRPSHDTGHRRLAHFPEPPFSQKCSLYSACYKDIY